MTLIWLSQLNLQAGDWDIFFPQFVQGCGIARMFVPLTTVTMASISPDKMGNATSLFSLMRNIGGSVGIAVTGTLLVRQRQSVSAARGEHISTLDPAAMARLAQMKTAFMAAGADATTATNQASSAMAGLLLAQLLDSQRLRIEVVADARATGASFSDSATIYVR